MDGQSQKEIAEGIEQVRSLFSQGEETAARALLDRLRAKWPGAAQLSEERVRTTQQYPDYHFSSGKEVHTLLTRGRIAEAEAEMERSQGRFDAALSTDLERSIATRRKDLVEFCSTVRTLADHGDLEKARASLRRLEMDFPGQKEVAAESGHLQSFEEQVRQAALSVRKMLSAEETTEARSLVLRLLERFRDNSSLKILLREIGEAERHAGEREEKARAWEALLGQGRFEEARNVLKRDPPWGTNQEHLNAAWQRLEDRERVVEERVRDVNDRIFRVQRAIRQSEWGVARASLQELERRYSDLNLWASLRKSLEDGEQAAKLEAERQAAGLEAEPQAVQLEKERLSDSSALPGSPPPLPSPRGDSLPRSEDTARLFAAGKSEADTIRRIRLEAATLARAGDLPGAIARLSQAVAKYPKSGSLKADMAVAAGELGRRQKSASPDMASTQKMRIPTAAPPLRPAHSQVQGSCLGLIGSLVGVLLMIALLYGLR